MVGEMPLDGGVGALMDHSTAASLFGFHSMTPLPNFPFHSASCSVSLRNILINSYRCNAAHVSISQSFCFPYNLKCKLKLSLYPKELRAIRGCYTKRRQISHHWDGTGPSHILSALGSLAHILSPFLYLDFRERQRALLCLPFELGTENTQYNINT